MDIWYWKRIKIPFWPPYPLLVRLMLFWYALLLIFVDVIDTLVVDMTVVVGNTTVDMVVVSKLVIDMVVAAEMGVDMAWAR